MTDVYVGIDPGAKGYICALAPGDRSIEFLSNTQAPKFLYDAFVLLGKHYNVRQIMIEDVHSLHGASAKSNFNFGRNLGLLYGIIGSTGMGIDIIQPKVWQKEIGVVTPVKKKGAPKVKASVRTRQIKLDVAAICTRLYPEVNIRGPKGGLIDGMSDALMIAHFCSIKYR